MNIVYTYIYTYIYIYTKAKGDVEGFDDLLTSGPSNCFVDPSYFSFDACVGAQLESRIGKHLPIEIRDKSKNTSTNRRLWKIYVLT